VVSALVVVWELFDYPCGQRLVAALREHTDRLRGNGGLRCSDQVSERLKKVSPATIDRLLKRERQVRRLRRDRMTAVYFPPWKNSMTTWRQAGRIQYYFRCSNSFGVRTNATSAGFEAERVARDWKPISGN
jgi:hypothetical protein